MRRLKLVQSAKGMVERAKKIKPNHLRLVVDNVPTKKILLVEDEISFAEIVRDYLERAGHDVELSHTGVGVIDMVRRDAPDLILLDTMLPGIDGTEICQGIREFSDLPVIMVTAKVNEVDRLLGYDLGVDDYICKPVKPREVLARIKAVLRRYDRPKALDSESLIRLDEDAFSAHVKGEPLDLTPVEFRLLNLLTKKAGRVFSRTQIMDVIYVGEAHGSDRSIDSHVKNLRKKISAVLGEQDSPIHSVYGLGYKFELVE